VTVGRATIFSQPGRAGRRYRAASHRPATKSVRLPHGINHSVTFDHDGIYHIPNDIYHMVYTTIYTMVHSIEKRYVKIPCHLPYGIYAMFYAMVYTMIPFYKMNGIYYGVYHGILHGIHSMVYTTVYSSFVWYIPYDVWYTNGTIYSLIYITIYINGIYHCILNGIYVLIYHGVYHDVTAPSPVHSEASPIASMSPAAPPGPGAVQSSSRCSFNV
jgi:hypothetical protein